MHRKPLLNMLAAYLASFGDEEPMVSRVRDFVNQHPDCFQRGCRPGHITGSAWIISNDRQRHLLTYHSKLDKWLQLGGHADGETEVAEVALREAREESGMQRFEFFRPKGVLVPLDVDVHVIPARGCDPQHEHHDIRFLLIAGAGQELEMSEESRDLRWFSDGEIRQVTREESVLRMLQKARMFLGTQESFPESC